MERFCGWPVNVEDKKFYSVTTGLVRNNWDEKHPGMVRAEYFLGAEGKNVTGWMPVASPYASQECGMYALPEIGSEVIIAFNMGDGNCPIVIGCLWNQKNSLPKKTAAEGNTIKRFRTKGGCEVVFREEKEKEAIELSTPAGLRLCIEDEKKTIAIEDKDKKNGILLKAEEGSVKLFADKKMVLEVGGKAMVTLDGSAGAVTVKGDDVKEEASKSYTVKGQNVKLEGTQMEINGKSQLSLKSNGVTQVKGSLVKIN